MIDFLFESFTYGKEMRRNDPQQRDHKIQKFEQPATSGFYGLLFICTLRLLRWPLLTA